MNTTKIDTMELIFMDDIHAIDLGTFRVFKFEDAPAKPVEDRYYEEILERKKSPNLVKIRHNYWRRFDVLMKALDTTGVADDERKHALMRCDNVLYFAYAEVQDDLTGNAAIGRAGVYGAYLKYVQENGLEPSETKEFFSEFNKSHAPIGRGMGTCYSVLIPGYYKPEMGILPPRKREEKPKESGLVVVSTSEDSKTSPKMVNVDKPITSKPIADKSAENEVPVDKLSVGEFLADAIRANSAAIYELYKFMESGSSKNKEPEASNTDGSLEQMRLQMMNMQKSVNQLGTRLDAIYAFLQTQTTEAKLDTQLQRVSDRSKTASDKLEEVLKELKALNSQQFIDRFTIGSDQYIERIAEKIAPMISKRVEELLIK